ncbi:MAG: hypothetical protein M1816_003137 [Peltula sp. TS41687]|nr:MAG: hypothetical protein M1816_003137 [Peltula sp. TS41687]
MVIKSLASISHYGTQIGGGRCQFAVRGGGHTPFAGSANIEQGVTIDLSQMKAVTINENRSLTSIGPGARWVEVYLKLDAMELAVPGGRVGAVGVAGLTTGGGLSFFAPRYGLVCDNVDNFEVVLASGEIVNANSKENSDLWFGLKGGSNNFGIVTRFDLRTFRQGKFWGGFIGYPIETRSEQFQAFEELNAAQNYDTYSTIINSYTFVLPRGWSIANNYEYTQPETYPVATQSFTDLKPQTFNTMRISNLSDFTIELSDLTSHQLRRQFSTLTVGNSAALLSDIFDANNSTVQMLKDVQDLSWSLSYQALPASTIAQSGSTGGNPLGLDPAEGSLVIILWSVFWSNATDDARIESALKKLFVRSNELAWRKGLYNDWVYLNYAARWQDPISGYGFKNKRRLQEISRKYDPKGVFQKDCPGGFKLFPPSSGGY